VLFGNTREVKEAGEYTGFHETIEEEEDPHEEKYHCLTEDTATEAWNPIRSTVDQSLF
jgi:hypothetical protein